MSACLLFKNLNVQRELLQATQTPFNDSHNELSKPKTPLYSRCPVHSYTKMGLFRYVERKRERGSLMFKIQYEGGSLLRNAISVRGPLYHVTWYDVPYITKIYNNINIKVY